MNQYEILILIIYGITIFLDIHFNPIMISKNGLHIRNNFLEIYRNNYFIIFLRKESFGSLFVKMVLLFLCYLYGSTWFFIILIVILSLYFLRIRRGKG